MIDEVDEIAALRLFVEERQVNFVDPFWKSRIQSEAPGAESLAAVNTKVSWPEPPHSSSAPPPPNSTSLPAPPFSTLLAALPTITSLPEPPMAFSMVTPAAIETLPFKPPTSENDFSFRLMRWFAV